MATKAQGALYAAGGEPEDIDANQAYQEAQRKLMEALNARKNRLFDPTLLALAEGFLAPTKTGSFGESLGIAAGKVREAEAASLAEQQKLAEAQMGLASQGIALQQQRARQRALMGMLSGEQPPTAAPSAPGATPAAPTAPTAPGAVPAGAPGAPATPMGAPGAAAIQAADKPPGMEGVKGIPVQPPDPNIANRRSIILAAVADPNARPMDVAKALNDLATQRYKTTERGTLDLATGLFYRAPSPIDVAPTTITLRTVPGAGAFSVPADQAKRHMELVNEAMSTGNASALRQFEASLIRTFPEEPPAGTAKTSPVAPGRIMSASEIEAAAAGQKAEATTMATKLAEAAVEKEVQAEQKASSARTMLFNADRVTQLVRQSPQAFGIFSRPTLMSALGNVISRGLQTPGGTINMAGFEDAIRQAMPGVKQRDIDNVMAAAGSLAEIELVYTQLYMAKQGQITEGEREIVRRIGGNVSQSPGSLLEKAKLLKLRAQHDLNVNDAWREFKAANPRANFMEFERSNRYRDLRSSYDQTLYGAFGLERPGAAPAPKFNVRRVQE
jgi:hypothetical protein